MVGYEPDGREKLMNRLIKLGYDGIIIDTDTWNDTGDENAVTSKQFIVFNPENVRPV
jgi:septum formation inhibitor-activating ATPase MinD